jgi:hypothetical protein
MSDNHSSENNSSDNHSSDNHSSDNNLSENNLLDNLSDNHSLDNHLSDNQPSDNNLSANNTNIGEGYVIEVEHTNINNETIIHTTFNTTDPEHHIPQIKEDLKETIEIVNDDNPETVAVMNEIKNYAALIKCENFHEKGSIEDYSLLFQVASNIANETKKMELDIDVDGFNEFGTAADELASLFTSYILKLENISIINDLSFLYSVADSLKKIVNLSNVFSKFKETIIATSTIKIPKSANDTKVILEGVMQEVNCAMNYINHFVNPEYSVENSELSLADKNIINKSVETIENWNNSCEHGVSNALKNNPSIQYLTQTNINLKQKKVQLSLLTNTLKTKLSFLKK